MNKEDFLKLIKSHIDNEGYHLTIVSGNSALPRYAYTIGFKEIFNFEIVFAGAEYYKKDEIELIVENIFNELNRGIDWENLELNLEGLGTFNLSSVHSSWSKLMLLGVWDYYKINDLTVLQIIPDRNHYTLDIPNMTTEYNPSKQPIWKWLTEEWGYPVQESSIVFTNIETLFGKKITEVMRWEESEWEMFAGNGEEVNKENLRAISLGTILGIDPTLMPAIELPVEKGIWRDEDSLKWNSWG